MTWILAHPLQIIVAYWVFSAFASGMPDPTSSSSLGYVWLNRSLHILAGNVTSVFQSRYSSYMPPPPPPEPGTSSITTGVMVTEQRSAPLPNNGK